MIELGGGSTGPKPTAIPTPYSATSANLIFL